MIISEAIRSWRPIKQKDAVSKRGPHLAVTTKEWGTDPGVVTDPARGPVEGSKDWRTHNETRNITVKCLVTLLLSL